MLDNLIRASLYLIEKANDLSSGSLVLGLVVVENSLGGGQDEVAELSGGQNVRGPALEVVQRNVESGRDDAALVDSSQKLDDDLAGSMVIDDFEFADVAAFLHQLEELNQDLGARTEQNLVSLPDACPCARRSECTSKR